MNADVALILSSRISWDRLFGSLALLRTRMCAAGGVQTLPIWPLSEMFRWVSVSSMDLVQQMNSCLFFRNLDLFLQSLERKREKKILALTALCFGGVHTFACPSCAGSLRYYRIFQKSNNMLSPRVYPLLENDCKWNQVPKSIMSVKDPLWRKVSLKQC